MRVETTRRRGDDRFNTPRKIRVKPVLNRWVGVLNRTLVDADDRPDRGGGGPGGSPRRRRSRNGAPRRLTNNLERVRPPVGWRESGGAASMAPSTGTRIEASPSRRCSRRAGARDGAHAPLEASGIEMRAEPLAKSRGAHTAVYAAPRAAVESRGSCRRTRGSPRELRSVARRRAGEQSRGYAPREERRGGVLTAP